MLINLGLVAVGFALLYFGARSLLTGTLDLANKLKLPIIIVTIVIVGIGTNIPEIAVSISAAQLNASNVALGNVIGSNVANILFALGLAAFAQVLIIKKRHAIDLLILVIANILLVMCLWFRWLNFATGIVFILLLLLYLSISAFYHKDETSTDPKKIKSRTWWKIILYIVFGLVALLFGSSWFVKGILALGYKLGISEDVLGLSVVAFATSLPEAVNLFIAAKAKQIDFIIGTILGSNIFNCLALTGIVLLIRRPVSVVGLQHGAFFMLAVNILFAALIFFRVRINYIVGIIMLLLYVAYLFWSF